MSDPLSEYNLYYHIPVVDHNRNQGTQFRPPIVPSHSHGALYAPPPSYIPIRPTTGLVYPPLPSPGQGFINPGEIFLPRRTDVNQAITPLNESVVSDRRPAQLLDSNNHEFSNISGGHDGYGLPPTQLNVPIDPFLFGLPQTGPSAPLPQANEPWSFPADPVPCEPLADFQAHALPPSSVLDAEALGDVIVVGEVDEVGEEEEEEGGGNGNESSEYLDQRSKEKGKGKSRQKTPKESVEKRKRGRPRKDASILAKDENPTGQKKKGKGKGTSGKGGWIRRPKACAACNNRHIRIISVYWWTTMQLLHQQE
ncbi:hypothetical protein I309_04263 [Cryptococcus deuterogattii LA55]|nr:hypothetical protein I309_04263 [Cryptococcus deuterogattii LA55]KIR32438.1 hypothetical protein I352_05265 [Cryptococcus deuterogattii MMRL2647]KIR74140.1 hypothetical protein I310_01737 [Cryptococcus deuterogattii CA1014]KIR94374.1 hypothetical protein I304_02016 [Cryptococcus deuterogattii CBS 10090]KIR96842.1 hypothetical protein L804_05940 [Cryptococcus deuterogattii 2001/935-1]